MLAGTALVHLFGNRLLGHTVQGSEESLHSIYPLTLLGEGDRPCSFGYRLLEHTTTRMC